MTEVAGTNLQPKTACDLCHLSAALPLTAH